MNELRYGRCADRRLTLIVIELSVFREKLGEFFQLTAVECVDIDVSSVAIV